MAEFDFADPLRRLQILQRDLVAFSESRLPNVERLATQLDASAEDFRKLLERERKNDASRAVVAPNANPVPDTMTVDGMEYRISDVFRQDVLRVADELDLDELDAARLCLSSQLPEDSASTNAMLAMRAVLRFHEQRQALLHCLRILLQLSLDSDSDDDNAGAFEGVVKELVQGAGGRQTDSSAYWRKCIDGLSDIEDFLKKVSEYKDKLLVTGQGFAGDQGDWLVAQRLLLTRQHESMAAILTFLIRGSHVQPEDYRGFLSKAASLESDADITIHYLPVLTSGAAHFASDYSGSVDAAHDLHRLFAAGPGQLQWRQTTLKAAATACWLSEYNARFINGNADNSRSDSERKHGEEMRSELFFSSLKDKAFHFMLAAAAYLKPVVWHDPARTAIVDFLVESNVLIPADAPRPSDDFSLMTLHELQAFTESFVTHMPDTLRKLKVEEDDRRRNMLSQATDAGPQTDLDLERFMVIMACAFQDDPEASRDFWSDREGNLYGFLRWASQRLPTPRVAAFCQLLRSIACDAKSANDAHRFLLEDAGPASGKVRKAHAVSWSQMFSELELYATSLKDRPSAPQGTHGQDRSTGEMLLEEPETGIMLDAYLGLAAHVCRTSPDARNWLLKDQPFHVGEVMFQLARSASVSRIRACCLDLLAALLTDKTLEVRNGVWVLLDSWISSGGLDGASLSRPQTKPQYPAKQYLQVYANSAEAGASLVALLNALIAPASSSLEFRLDALPFPENLGAPHRHAGIDSYVDFVMDAVFARKVLRMHTDGEASLINVIRFECLNFMCQCLGTFNEDLVLLANTTKAGVETAMETKSLATYARLHPFARTMEWLFDKGVVGSLFAALQQNIDALNDADFNSPLVQATSKSIEVLDLAWKLQPTYFDLVRPAIVAQTSRAHAVSSAWACIDDIFLSRPDAVLDVAQFVACTHAKISLGSLALLRRISSSKRLSDASSSGGRQRHSNRLLSVLMPISSALTTLIAQDFILEAWDLETSDVPVKVIKATAVLDLLLASLESSDAHPTVAHCLLGFHCRERDVEILPDGPFARSMSLFHALASCAATSVTITDHGNTSWLLRLKRRCLEVILKLAVSRITTNIVKPELRSMDFLAALSQNQAPAAASPLWDDKPVVDPRVLLDSSSLAICDFMHVREGYFQLAATDLRNAAAEGSFSVQEKIVSILLGTIKLPSGSQDPTRTVFELFDFFDLETVPPSVAQTSTFVDDDVVKCTKDDPDTVVAYDIKMAEELLILQKRDLKEKGLLKDPPAQEHADNEIGAILAALTTQNNFMAIHCARLDALEAWVELLSLMITRGGLNADGAVTLSLQGLLIALPKYEKALADDLDAAALLAKVALTFTHAVSPASHDSSEQTAHIATERLVSSFRISLKAIADGATDLALRDVAYRTSCAVVTTLLSSSSTLTTAKQLLQLTNNAGERVFAVVAEDAFSGRGVTRVSSLLFLNALVSLFQSLKVSGSLLRALTKLNLVPVLIDTTIANVGAALKSEDDMVATLAYFHTALALLLHLCQTSDGTQVVLNSGLFAAIDDSKLFSTDPDIGMDSDNPAALKEFYLILADVVRLITATVVQKGVQPGRAFLQQHRFTVQAIFKQASRGQAVEVADELGKLILATDFLEVGRVTLLMA